jgi:diguanylate cyclase (GGDEF)-like protein
VETSTPGFRSEWPADRIWAQGHLPDESDEKARVQSEGRRADTFQVNSGAGRSRGRRLITSPVLLVAAIAVAVATALWFMQALEDLGDVRAEAQGRHSAEVIAAAVARPHLHAEDLVAGRLVDEEVGEIQVVVDELRRSGRLLGLAVWRLDGAPLYRDAAPGRALPRPTAADLARADRPESWIVHGRTPDREAQVHVFVPVLGEGRDRDDVVALMNVVLPYDELAQVAQTTLDRQRIGAVVLLLLPIVGFADLQRRLRRREREARHDPLTGLLNGVALRQDGRGLLSRANDRRPLALLLIDLSEFKAVNDTLGHSAGDLLLKQVAASLRGAVRAGDLVSRLGGDEFAVLLTDLPDAAAAQERAEQLLRRLRQASFTVDGLDLVIDASIGIALAPQHGTDVSDLLQRADTAMYQAKRSNRDTMVYDATTDENSVGQLAMVTELRRALDNEEFVLHYQPKISLTDRRVTSVEALVRWQHPTRGVLPPGVFLPVLERSGLMQPLTRWVLREAVKQAVSWRGAGMPLPIAVNINPRSLLEADLPARVLAILRGADLPASFLELEITETAVMTDPARAAAVLRQLHARGIKVSIDDFGAGYTSLAHLRTLPIAALKLDRSLISDMLERDEDHAVTQALIDLAHRLGLTVIAEGVETEAVLERLSTLGCDEAQGYLMSPPVDPAALKAWVAERALEQTVL